MADRYELDASVSRDDAAAILRALGDGVAGGAVRLGEDGAVVEVLAWVDAEVEYESGEEVELEVELTWHPTGESAGEGAGDATPRSRRPTGRPPDGQDRRNRRGRRTVAGSGRVRDAGREGSRRRIAGGSRTGRCD